MIGQSSPVRTTMRPAAELDRLGDEIAELSAHLEAATARLLTLIREFDARGGWNTGFRSCAAWLSWRVGLDLGAARQRVRVARALATLPRLADALGRGELSYAKVRALTRVATPETQEILLTVGKAGTAAHVERIVRGWRRSTARRRRAKPRGSTPPGASTSIRTTTACSSSAGVLRPRSARCSCRRSAPRARPCISARALTLSNLALLCRRHHRAVHEEGFQLHRLPDGELRFRRPDGRLVPEVPPPPRVPADPTGALRAQNKAQGLRLTPRTATPLWLGERMDVGWAIGVLHPLANPRAMPRGRDRTGGSSPTT